MSKEFEKFQADYKKLQAKIKKYSPEEAAAARTRVNSAYTNTGEGERHLADSMVIARKNGVTGNELNDFMKDKDFKEAYQLMYKAYDHMAEQLVAMETFSNEAAVVQAEVQKLLTAVDKDLKSRKDKSESKKDIEKLQAQLTEDVAGLKTAAGKWGLIEPLKRKLPENFGKNVSAVLKQAPAAQEKKLDDTMVPQLLVDRKLNSNLKRALSLGKSIATACEKAIDLAGNDMQGALTLVKGAGAEFKELTTLNAAYQKVAKDYKMAIDDSRDKAKLLKAIEAIEKAWSTSESKVRGTATTLKKAG